VGLTTRVAVLFCLTVVPGFVGSWSGPSVDSHCYNILERNVNAFETSPVARDRNQQVRYCSPKKKTKAFAVVMEDWTLRKLDLSGNSKAAELVRNAGKKPPLVVAVTGEVSGEIIKVNSISFR
jgi:hypothetical protein